MLNLTVLYLISARLVLNMFVIEALQQRHYQTVSMRFRYRGSFKKLVKCYSAALKGKALRKPK